MFKDKKADNKKIQNDIMQKLTFDNISSILSKIGLIDRPFSNGQKVCVEFPNIDSEIKKSDNLDTSLNVEEFTIRSEIFNYDININQIFNLYNKKCNNISNEPYSIEDFTLIVRIFTSILTNFNDDLFKYDFNDETLFSKKNKIKLTNFKSANILKGNINEKLENLYKENKDFDNYEEIEDDVKLKNLFFLINVFTMFGAFKYNPLNLDNLMKNIDVFNSFCFNDMKIFVLILFHLIILSDIIIKKITVEKFLSVSKKNKNVLPFNSFSPIFFYFNGDLSSINDQQVKMVLLQLVIKFHLLPNIVSNIAFSSNFHVVTINEIESITNYLFPDKNQKNNIDDMSILSKDDLFSLLDTLPKIDKFFLKLPEIEITNSNKLEQKVMDALTPFLPIIIKAKSFCCEIENSEDINIKKNIPFTYFYDELVLLISVIKLNLKIKTTKNKTKGQSNITNFFFRFTSKCFSFSSKKNLSSTPHVRDVMLYLTQSHCSESTSLTYLSKRGNLTELYFQIQKVISALSPFKKYSIGIRITKAIIINEELKFLLHIVYLQLENYIHENASLNKSIVFYEGEYITYKHTIVVNSVIKQKNKNGMFAKYLKKLNLAYLNFLLKFSNELSELFDLFMVHDEISNTYPFNPRVLIRNFEENQIIFINKENQMIDIFVYVTENEFTINYHDKIFLMLKNMKTDDVGKDAIENIYFISNKKWIVSKNFFVNYEAFFNLVNYVYIIDLSTNYDCLLKEKGIILHSLKNSEKKENFFEKIFHIFQQYFEILKTICIDKKLRFFKEIAFISRKKAFVLKDGIFALKKIIDNNYACDFISNEKIISSACSYPLVMFLPNVKGNEEYNVNSLFTLYNNFSNLKSCEGKEIIEQLQKILENYAYNFDPLIFNQKYYEEMKKIKIQYDKVMLFPIDIKSHFVIKDKNRKNEFCLADKIVKFEFKNTKLSFFKPNEIGKLFTFGKINNTLEFLNTISKVRKVNFSNEIIRSDILLTLVLFMKKKYYCNYVSRKNISLLIANFMFPKESKLVNSKDELILVEFDVFADEVRKYKKKKKKQNLIEYRESDELNNKLNLNTNNEMNENIESENGIVTSSSTHKLTKGEVIKKFFGSNFKKLKNIFGK